MPVSRPNEPGGKVRRWVNRSLLFLDSGLQTYALPLQHQGFATNDIITFRDGLSAFLSGRQLNDTSFCLCMDVLGALLAWMDENEDLTPDAEREAVSFMFECLMDGQVTLGATASAKSTYTALSGF